MIAYSHQSFTGHLKHHGISILTPKGFVKKMRSKLISYKKNHIPSDITDATHKVLVGGCFDLLHYGHLNFLKSAKNQGECLIIALESDESIKASKGRPPIHTQQQRAEILAELECVDHILLLPPLNGYEDYSNLVQELNPEILAVTQGDPQTENKQKQADLIGASLVIVNNLLDGLSSSIIRSKLAD